MDWQLPKYLRFALGAGLVVFALTVWPTTWRYADSGEDRVHRITGRAQSIGGYGGMDWWDWEPPSAMEVVTFFVNMAILLAGWTWVVCLVVASRQAYAAEHGQVAAVPPVPPAPPVSQQSEIPLLAPPTVKYVLGVLVVALTVAVVVAIAGFLKLHRTKQERDAWRSVAFAGGPTPEEIDELLRRAAEVYPQAAEVPAGTGLLTEEEIAEGRRRTATEMPLLLTEEEIAAAQERIARWQAAQTARDRGGQSAAKGDTEGLQAQP